VPEPGAAQPPATITVKVSSSPSRMVVADLSSDRMFLPLIRMATPRTGDRSSFRNRSNGTRYRSRRALSTSRKLGDAGSSTISCFSLMSVPNELTMTRTVSPSSPRGLGRQVVIPESRFCGDSGRIPSPAGVVLVDQLLDLVELGEPLEIVDDVDEVRLERALEGGPEELLLVLEVPEDQRLGDLRLLRDLGERGARVAVAGEEPGSKLKNAKELQVKIISYEELMEMAKEKG